MQKRLILSFSSVIIATSLAVGPAFAIGGGGGDSRPVPSCKRGQVWDKNKRKCVPQRQGALDDDSIYETGRALAMQGRYGEAITILSLAADKTDPRILNYLGYSHRKAGPCSGGTWLLPGSACDTIRTTRWCGNIWARPISRWAMSPRPGRSLRKSRSDAAPPAENIRNSHHRSPRI